MPESYKRIEDTETYNRALRQAVDFLKDHWFDGDAGIVAATLVDGDRYVSATSRFLAAENRWLHAERAALEEFMKIFGCRPWRDSFIAVTLSPCVLDAPLRSGGACVYVLKSYGVSRVCFGFLDSRQSPDISVYENLGLNATVCTDTEIQTICRNLYGLFSEFSHLRKGGNPWPKIKQDISPRPWL